MLHKHEPIDEKQMHIISPNNSICEILRNIYWKTDDPEIKLKCRIATTMAKRMTRKLSEYKKGWESNFWDKNEKYQKALQQQLNKVYKKHA